MKRLLTRLFFGLLTVLVVALIAMVIIERRRSIDYMGEKIGVDEPFYTAEVVASALESINASTNQSPPYRRDVHSKAHGCVRAEVSVLPDLRPELRHGVFETPGRTYQAWIRYSSGNTNMQHDKERDARGMAIKVMGVTGPSVLGSEGDTGTQDFIMINSPVFFIRNIAEYARFGRMLADGSRLGYFFGGGTPNVLRWHLRDMYLANATLKRAPDSLLHTQYHSLTAYRLGPSTNIKFTAKSCTQQAVAAVDRRKPDFLRDEMSAELGKGPACFDLMVQPQVAGRNMPVEDPTVRWKEKDSPFVAAARITVPQQTFDTAEQNAFCEQLSFSPFHALAAHEPIGGLNRLRKAVYLEDARYRRSMTADLGATTYRNPPEPTSWCLDVTGKTCPATP